MMAGAVLGVIDKLAVAIGRLIRLKKLEADPFDRSRSEWIIAPKPFYESSIPNWFGAHVFPSSKTFEVSDFDKTDSMAVAFF